MEPQQSWKSESDYAFTEGGLLTCTLPWLVFQRHKPREGTKKVINCISPVTGWKQWMIWTLDPALNRGVGPVVTKKRSHFTLQDDPR